MNKKAFMFTMDAFFASVLLISSLMFLSHLNVQKPATEDMEFISKDILETLSKLTVNDMKETIPFLQDEIENGTITNPNNSILVQIGEYWARDTADSRSKGELLAKTVIEDLVPPGHGFNLTVGGDSLYDVPKLDYQTNKTSKSPRSTAFKGSYVLVDSFGAPIRYLCGPPNLTAEQRKATGQINPTYDIWSIVDTDPEKSSDFSTQSKYITNWQSK